MFSIRLVEKELWQNEEEGLVGVVPVLCGGVDYDNINEEEISSSSATSGSTKDRRGGAGLEHGPVDANGLPTPGPDDFQQPMGRLLQEDVRWHKR